MNERQVGRFVGAALGCVFLALLTVANMAFPEFVGALPWWSRALVAFGAALCAVGAVDALRFRP